MVFGGCTPVRIRATNTPTAVRVRTAKTECETRLESIAVLIPRDAGFMLSTRGMFRNGETLLIIEKIIYDLLGLIDRPEVPDHLVDCTSVSQKVPIPALLSCLTSNREAFCSLTEISDGLGL